MKKCFALLLFICFVMGCESKIPNTSITNKLFPVGEDGLCYSSVVMDKQKLPIGAMWFVFSEEGFRGALGWSPYTVTISGKTYTIPVKRGVYSPASNNVFYIDKKGQFKSIARVIHLEEITRLKNLPRHSDELNSKVRNLISSAVETEGAEETQPE